MILYDKRNSSSRSESRKNRWISISFLLVIVTPVVTFGLDAESGNNNYNHSSIMLYPSPNIQKKNEERFILKKNTKIVFDSSSKLNASLFQDELRKAIGLTLKGREDQRKKTEPNSIFMSIGIDERLNEKAVEGLSHNEGYYLSVTKEHISIIGADSGGQVNGIISLLQLVDPKTRTVPILEIHDWPKIAFRGLRGHLPRNNREEIENFKRIIRAMAFCRINQLWIRDLYVRRFPASIRWNSHPEICDEDALPKSLVKELIDYASKYNVKVMGSLAATADIVWSIYPHLIEMAPNESPATVAIKHEKNPTSKYRFGSRFNFCPSKEENYRLLFDLIDEMVPLFTSEVFDLGIDEVDQDYNGSRWVACNLCKGKDPVKLFADYVNQLADYVTSKGKIPLINSASFIKGHAGDFYDIYKSVSLIRKNIIINNWSDGHIRATNKAPWNPLNKFRSSEYFKQYGLEKMVHLVGYDRRWKDRPELLETKGYLDCYGGCVTHYKYMTNGQFSKSPTIDDMTFNGNHFWNPNHPEIGSKEEEVDLSYARGVVQGILDGKSFIQAATNGRSILTNSK